MPRAPDMASGLSLSVSLSLFQPIIYLSIYLSFYLPYDVRTDLPYTSYHSVETPNLQRFGTTAITSLNGNHRWSTMVSENLDDPPLIHHSVWKKRTCKVRDRRRNPGRTPRRSTQESESPWLAIKGPNNDNNYYYYYYYYCYLLLVICVYIYI